MKRIPISAAKLIAEKYDYSQVIVIARKVGDDGGEDGLLTAPQLLHRRSGMKFHALLLEGFTGERRNLRILDRQDAIERLHHRHLSAEIAVEACELDPDGARANHQK